MDIRTWSDDIAILIADALVDSGHISKENLSAVANIVSEELYVRLTVNDYPPPPNNASQEIEA